MAMTAFLQSWAPTLLALLVQLLYLAYKLGRIEEHLSSQDKRIERLEQERPPRVLTVGR